ncbi:MAG: YvcK family protein, partial [Oscillospiraceae bacterium]|nr:YvcK family protein [Oscillospiraceae bacterium]
KAVKIYICNIMTQTGETDGYSVSDHVAAIEKHTYPGIIDFVVANDQPIPAFLEERYRQDSCYPIRIDEENLKNGTRLVLGQLVLIEDEYIRHNFSRLARLIMSIYKYNGGQKKTKADKSR